MYDFLFIKNCGEYLRLPFSEIIYVEAVNKYIKIVTKKRFYLIPTTMGAIEKSLPYNLFRRIHRSYIVSFHHINSFDYNAVHIEGQKLPIGKHYKASLLDQITVLATDEKNGVDLSNPNIKKLLISVDS
jgi:DNA-binding LytR/AlgR family response regulator